MRILFLTNFFPPYGFGGMELSCQETFQGMCDRGHTCKVLTSTQGVDQPEDDGAVMRRLHLQMALAPHENAWRFLRLRKHVRQNSDTLKSTVEEFAPDVVYVWGMWNLDQGLAALSERLMNGRVLYRFADYWPALPSQRHVYWQREGRGRIASTLKKAIAPLALANLRNDTGPPPTLSHGYCVSQAVRRRLVELGVPVSQMPVVYSGFDLGRFQEVKVRSKWGRMNDRLTILFAGRLTPEKGVETILRAMALVSHVRPELELNLTVVGAGEHEYVGTLHQEAAELRLDRFIHFTGGVERKDVARLMASHQFVVIPSVWEDPLPRVAIEAMASGCLVAGSRIGGLEEIIQDRSSGLLFPPGDHHALAEILIEACNEGYDPLPMIEKARTVALSKFNFSTMLDQVETLLRSAGLGSAEKSSENMELRGQSVAELSQMR